MVKNGGSTSRTLSKGRKFLEPSEMFLQIAEDKEANVLSSPTKVRSGIIPSEKE